jgi:hypothetical protein
MKGAVAQVGVGAMTAKTTRNRSEIATPSGRLSKKRVKVSRIVIRIAHTLATFATAFPVPEFASGCQRSGKRACRRTE